MRPFGNFCLKATHKKIQVDGQNGGKSHQISNTTKMVVLIDRA